MFFHWFLYQSIITGCGLFEVNSLKNQLSCLKSAPITNASDCFFLLFLPWKLTDFFSIKIIIWLECNQGLLFDAVSLMQFINTGSSFHPFTFKNIKQTQSYKAMNKPNGNWLMLYHINCRNSNVTYAFIIRDFIWSWLYVYKIFMHNNFFQMLTMFVKWEKKSGLNEKVVALASGLK